MYTKEQIERLNKHIESFGHIYAVEKDDKMTRTGISRLVMLDRYAQKDISLKTLEKGDTVVTVIKLDPKFPARGIGKVLSVKGDDVMIEVEEEYRGSLSTSVEIETGIITRKKNDVLKPLELYWEQISRRVAGSLAALEGPKHIEEVTQKFFEHLRDLKIVPAGRVLYGAGSESKVTYFNCFVLPFVGDSRAGISKHRTEVLEIMSHGGGVGTNGSTLRPRGTVAKGVGGKSSGSVSWLNDIASLTHLVEQGGSRRGAQMIMLADWHPDVIEFIISKMQNPKILRYLVQNSENEIIRKMAANKLKFKPLTSSERTIYEHIVKQSDLETSILNEAREKLAEGGAWEVNNPEFLSGANISIAITKEFMAAVKADKEWELRFPDLEKLTKEQKAKYDEIWQDLGDVREWENLGYPVKTYDKIKATELWDLINFCATYSAEPGVFFMDNANDMTNARGYGQKVVATNPCGEQPLAPYSVCNLAALNLAEFADKKTKEVKWDELEEAVKTCVRLQDNVIDSTPYFLEANEIQAKGERRLGLGVMGLHDLLIWCGEVYGSKSANKLVDKVFEKIAITAYKASIELAKEKGSFSFLDEKSSREKFIESGFIKKLPKEIKDGILAHGIRNSHLLTIAPTGSTGTMVGVSTGLEPYFGFKYFRSGRLGKFIEIDAPIVAEWKEVNKFSGDKLPDIFVSAMELSPEEHADTQCVIQNWIDSSISKTVNAPAGYDVKDVEKIYMRLYDGGAKGGTVYVDGSRDAQVLSLTKDDNDVKVSKKNQMSLASINEVLDLTDPIDDAPEIEGTRVLTNLRADKLDREVGVEVGNICPICNEGQVIKIGGCNTCNNCNAQLKCGL